MNEVPSVTDDRVREIKVNERPVWVVRFKNKSLLKTAFDSLAELNEALGADQGTPETISVSEEDRWVVVEFDLKGKPLYAVYNGSEGELSDEGSFQRWDIEQAAAYLNDDPHQP